AQKAGEGRGQSDLCDRPKAVVNHLRALDEGPRLLVPRGATLPNETEGLGRGLDRHAYRWRRSVDRSPSAFSDFARLLTWASCTAAPANMEVGKARRADALRWGVCPFCCLRRRGAKMDWPANVVAAPARLLTSAACQ